MDGGVSWFGTIFKRFRARRKVVASASAETDVTFGPITEDRMYLITRFSCEDETSSPTSKIRIGVAGHGYFHPLLEETSPAAGTLYGDTWPTHLVQGESLVARFTNAVSGDVLALYVEGYYLPEEPPSAILETAIFAGVGGVLPEQVG